MKKFAIVVFLILTPFFCHAGKDDETEVTSHIVSKIEQNPCLDETLYDPQTYLLLRTARLSHQILLTESWDVFTFLPIAFRMPVPQWIDEMFGNSWLGKGCKWGFHLTSFSLKAYCALFHPYELAISMVTRWLAHQTISLLHQSQTITDENLLSTVLFVLEEAGYNFAKTKPWSLDHDKMFPKVEKNVICTSMTPEKDFFIKSGFQNLPLMDYHRNGTCPHIPTFLSSSQASSIFPFQCLQLEKELAIPSGSCQLFEDNLKSSSPVALRKIMEKLNLSRYSQSFGIVVGESHNRISHLLFETILLQYFRALGVRDVLLELPPKEHTTVMEMASKKPDPSENFIIKKIRFALQLGMRVTLIDSDERPEMATKDCPISHVYDVKRERAFCNNIMSMPRNFIAFLGHMHLSHFFYGCKNTDQARALSFLLLPKAPSQKDLRANIEQITDSGCSEYVINRMKETLEFMNRRSIITLAPTVKVDETTDLNLLWNLLSRKQIGYDEIESALEREIL